MTILTAIGIGLLVLCMLILLGLAGLAFWLTRDPPETEQP